MWSRKWQPTPVFLPGKSHGQRSLAGYSSWGCKSRTWLSDWVHTVLNAEEKFRPWGSEHPDGWWLLMYNAALSRLRGVHPYLGHAKKAGLRLNATCAHHHPFLWYCQEKWVVELMGEWSCILHHVSRDGGRVPFFFFLIPRRNHTTVLPMSWRKKFVKSFPLS